MVNGRSCRPAPRTRRTLKSSRPELPGRSYCCLCQKSAPLPVKNPKCAGDDQMQSRASALHLLRCQPDDWLPSTLDALTFRITVTYFRTGTARVNWGTIPILQARESGTRITFSEEGPGNQNRNRGHKKKCQKQSTQRLRPCAHRAQNQSRRREEPKKECPRQHCSILDPRVYTAMGNGPEEGTDRINRTYRIET